jgi:NAD(P)-dependent dehydrogenase (short-subunit alcohol dehydrogenase family)
VLDRRSLVAYSRTEGGDAMPLLEEKVGLVTGAASGLGRATALLAAAEGSKVIVADIDDAGGQQTVEQIRAAQGEARFVHVDVAIAAEVEAMVAAAVDEYGGLDWASNNVAGGAGSFALLHEIDDRTWSRTIDVCLKGVFHGIKYEVPAMLQRGGGSIINISTASIFKGEAMLGAYVAAKGGVDALTKTGAAEYSARGIRVNSVAPGGFETPALARYFERFPEHRDRTIAQHAMRRLGRPEEVAETVIWLASDRASFVTGACMSCDGGVLVNSHML